MANKEQQPLEELKTWLIEGGVLPEKSDSVVRCITLFVKQRMAPVLGENTNFAITARKDEGVSSPHVIFDMPIPGFHDREKATFLANSFMTRLQAPFHPDIIFDAGDSGLYSLKGPDLDAKRKDYHSRGMFLGFVNTGTLSYPESVT